jgi:hypothetical protein
MADKVFAGNAVPIVKPVSGVHVRSRKKPLHRHACLRSRADVPAEPILFVFARFGSSNAKAAIVRFVILHAPVGGLRLERRKIGTTRSRVSFFMNKFRKLGLISYNGKIEVHSSMLSAILREAPQMKRDG